MINDRYDRGQQADASEIATYRSGVSRDHLDGCESCIPSHSLAAPSRSQHISCKTHYSSPPTRSGIGDVHTTRPESLLEIQRRRSPPLSSS